MNAYEAVLRALKAELNGLKVRWALVGGFAVSALGSGRSTTDVDLVAAVVDGGEAERLIFRMTQFGYYGGVHLEQEATGRLSTVRLLSPHSHETRILVDFIFRLQAWRLKSSPAPTTLTFFGGSRCPWRALLTLSQ